MFQLLQPLTSSYRTLLYLLIYFLSTPTSLLVLVSFFCHVSQFQVSLSLSLKFVVAERDKLRKCFVKRRNRSNTRSRWYLHVDLLNEVCRNYLCDDQNAI